MLSAWIKAGHLQEEVANKLSEWFETGLKPWDISRDAPYFGFEIPEAPGKYFYVWLDAPIGYIASFKNLCDRRDVEAAHPRGILDERLRAVLPAAPDAARSRALNPSATSAAVTRTETGSIPKYCAAAR